ncbi:MAG: hypothetical protein HFP81_02695 [Methylococcales symbiont of Hymedesmia sp. n. MRB-2018]|nr:MAG: hypothetical protein HFP81_02695 [Methylococcales symbiont of Hymedesmia sp. n. MRB-2018]ORU94500.1 MAG: hypothetical protein A6F72_08835 [Cycloclasticus sp. symbiont of Poecilosclerida sp. N]
MNKMEELFEKWEQEIASDHFVKDGIISNKHWEVSSKKILFILKETNNYKGNIAKLIEISVRKKTRLWARPTFHNVGRWAYGLLHYNGEKPSYKLAHKNRKDSLLSCSFINLKKN